MSNKLHFTGRVAAAPVMTRPSGDPITKFTLIRNESRGSDDNGDKRDERVVDIQFTAFGGRGEAIAKHVMEGDQLIIEARIENNKFTKENGTEVFGFNFVVENFEFGAPGKKKRAVLDAQNNG